MKNKKIFIVVGVILCLCIGLFMFNNKKNQIYMGINWNDNLETAKEKIEKNLSTLGKGYITVDINEGEFVTKYNDIDLKNEPIKCNVKTNGNLEIDLDNYKDKEEILYIRETYSFDESNPEELDILYKDIKTKITDKYGESIAFLKGNGESWDPLETFIYDTKNGYIKLSFSYLQELPHQQFVEVVYINPNVSKDEVLSSEFYDLAY